MEKDERKAFKWYKEVAEQGNAEAQNSLGDCYYNGKGVEQDASKAVEWYKKAAEQGNEDAKTKIKSYYKDKKASSKRYKKAAMSLLAVGALIKFISDIKE